MTTCPLCTAVTTTNWEAHPFEVRDVEGTVVLTARIPIRQCTRCRFEFLDDRAEEIRDAAVREYRESKGT